MNITIKNSASFGEAIATENDVKIGEMTFDYVTKDAININHTWVNPEFRGKGIAKKLLDFVIEMVRENEYKVSSTCSYASSIFTKSNDYDDVVINK